jgi:hypothetical protein
MLQSISLLIVMMLTLSRTHYETGGNEMNEKKREIFVGIDLHKRRWHVTVRDPDVELFSGDITGPWQSLRIKSARCIMTTEAGRRFV